MGDAREVVPPDGRRSDAARAAEPARGRGAAAVRGDRRLAVLQAAAGNAVVSRMLAVQRHGGQGPLQPQPGPANVPLTDGGERREGEGDAGTSGAAPTTTATPTDAGAGPDTTPAPGPDATTEEAAGPTDEDRLRKALTRLQHIASQMRFALLVKQGLDYELDETKGIFDPEFLFKNACEWVRQGNMTIRVLSRTHDATTRRAGKIAYFDATVAYPSLGGDYPIDSTTVTDPTLKYDEPGVLGVNSASGTRLDMYDLSSRTDTEIKATLVHEVQHSADQSWPGQRWIIPGGSAPNDYQSEFRAYWTQLGEAHPDDEYGSSSEDATNSLEVEWEDPVAGTKLTSATSFKNLRQENIFWHLVDTGYDYVAQNYVQNPAFKTMVDDYDRPSGGNMLNSVRIESLASLVDTCNNGMPEDDPAVVAMFAGVDDLDTADKMYLRDETVSAPFWTRAASRLSADVLHMLRNKVRFGTVHDVGDFPIPAGEPEVAYA